MSYQFLTTEERLRLKGLTRREAEAALFAGRGLLMREIAGEMGVSEGTVKTLIKRGREKLGCRSVRALAVTLLQRGFVSPTELVSRSER